ncbi:MAG: ABC transporter ATP-binding protein, partial [Acidobacteriota bacterium]
TPWTGRLRARDHEAVARALRRAGGEALAHRPLAEMSDGERQRMAIARALAQEPGVLVLDEPTAFLDLPSRLEFLDLLRRLAHNEGLAVLVTTHDLDAALACADRVWLLANGALRQGLPEELALDGSLARAFAAAGVAFDLERGSFRPRRALRASLHLDGDPLGVAWTRRALERLGLHATLGDRAAASDLPATGLQLRVERRPNDAEGTLCWWWSDGSASEEMISLAAVVERLEGRLEAPRR